MSIAFVAMGMLVVTIAAGQTSSHTRDTIKIGEYYFDRQLANVPLLSVVDLKTNKPVTLPEPHRWYRVELHCGLFDRYDTKASIESGNGQIKKTGSKNQYKLRATQDSSKTIELKVMHQMNRDTVVYVNRQWATPEKLTYVEKIEKVGVWQESIWLGIKK